MATGPGTVVPAPALTAPPNGLLVAALVIDHADEYGWGNGVRFAPENCADAQVYDPCLDGPEAVTFTDGAATQNSTTFTSATAAFTSADTGKSITSTDTANAVYTDGATTNASPTVTSASAAFTSDDVGKTISGAGIPGATTILAVVNSTTITMSANATATASPVTITIVARKVIRTGTTITSVTNATTVVLSLAAAATKAGTTFTFGGRTEGPNRPAVRDYTPFPVFAYDTCSTFGFEAAEYEARARRALAARESKAVEREFWAGTLFSANPHLAAGGTVETLVAGAAQGLRRSLALLSQAAADHNAGQAMIHVRPKVAELWFGLDMIGLVGGKLVTGNGHIVVPGAGYLGSAPDGTAPTATQEWGYVTDRVEVHRGPVAVFAPGVNGMSVDRTVNTVTLTAQRMYAPVFNGCTLSAVKIDTTVEL